MLGRVALGCCYRLAGVLHPLSYVAPQQQMARFGITTQIYWFYKSKNYQDLKLIIYSLEVKYISCTSKYIAITVFIIWLALWAGKMNQIACCDWLPKRARWSYLHVSCPLRTTCCIPQEQFPRKPYNKSFIDKACQWPHSFLRVCRPTILDKINGTSGPSLPPFQWYQNGAFLAPSRLHHCFGGMGNNWSILYCPRL